MQRCCTPRGGAQAVVPAAGRTRGRASRDTVVAVLEVERSAIRERPPRRQLLYLDTCSRSASAQSDNPTPGSTTRGSRRHGHRPLCSRAD